MGKRALQREGLRRHGSRCQRERNQCLLLFLRLALLSCGLSSVLIGRRAVRNQSIASECLPARACSPKRKPLISSPSLQFIPGRTDNLALATDEFGNVLYW